MSVGCAGTITEFANGDRPHFLFDKSGRVPIALTTAAGTGWGAVGMDKDQTFTLSRPLNTAAQDQVGETALPYLIKCHCVFLSDWKAARAISSSVQLELDILAHIADRLRRLRGRAHWGRSSCWTRCGSNLLNTRASTIRPTPHMRRRQSAFKRSKAM